MHVIRANEPLNKEHLMIVLMSTVSVSEWTYLDESLHLFFSSSFDLLSLSLAGWTSVQMVDGWPTTIPGINQIKQSVIRTVGLLRRQKFHLLRLQTSVALPTFHD